MKATKVVKVPFHYIGRVTLAAGVFSGQVRPDQFGLGLMSISDGYELFRVPNLKFRILAASAEGGLGVVTSVPNTSPGTVAQIGELLDSVVHEGPTETMWSRWVNVGKAVLAGPFSWYHTRIGTFDATEAAPATLCYVGSGTNTIAVEFYGLIEFKDIASTANTPEELAILRDMRLARAHQQAVRARERLLSQLSPGVSTGAPKATA